MGEVLGPPPATIPPRYTMNAQLLVQPKNQQPHITRRLCVPMCADSNLDVCRSVILFFWSVLCMSSWKMTIRNGIWSLALDSLKWAKHFCVCSHCHAGPSHSHLLPWGKVADGQLWSGAL